MLWKLLCRVRVLFFAYCGDVTPITCWANDTIFCHWFKPKVLYASLSCPSIPKNKFREYLGWFQSLTQIYKLFCSSLLCQRTLAHLPAPDIRVTWHVRFTLHVRVTLKLGSHYMLRSYYKLGLHGAYITRDWGSSFNGHVLCCRHKRPHDF